MNLKPINPYYKSLKRARIISPDSYHYTWIDPVTDRTEADVSYAKEILSKSWHELSNDQRNEYAGGLKGSLNRADLERIENDIQILLDVLEIKSESYVGAVPEFPNERYFEKMRENVAAIRSKHSVHTDTPDVPELPFNTWFKINAVEKILADVYEIANSQFYYYSNEIYAGDIVGLVL